MMIAASEPILAMQVEPMPRGVLHTITADLELQRTIVSEKAQSPEDARLGLRRVSVRQPPPLRLDYWGVSRGRPQAQHQTKKFPDTPTGELAFTVLAVPEEVRDLSHHGLGLDKDLQERFVAVSPDAQRPQKRPAKNEEPRKWVPASDTEIGRASCRER